MPDNSKVTPPPPAIQPAEYDFHSVPKNEMKDCVYYEYARESRAIIAEVRQLRRQLQAEVKRRSAKAGDRLRTTVDFTALRADPDEAIFETDKLMQLAGSIGFPETPWQELSSADKKSLTGFSERAIRRYNERVLKAFPPLRMDAFLGNSSLGEMKLNVWREKSTPERLRNAPAVVVEKSLISGFFRLDTRYSRKLLVDQFSNWLRANNLSRDEKDGRGRHSNNDALNQLGALRVRYFCTWAQAERLNSSLKLTPRAMHYGDQKAWNRACDEAVLRFCQRSVKTSHEGSIQNQPL